MTAERRRWLIGGGVVAVLAMAVWLQLSAGTSSPTPTGAAARPPRAAAPSRKQAVKAEPMSPVKLEALNLNRDEPTENQRNPFRFKPKVAAPARPETGMKPVAPAPVGPVTPAGPPPLPTIPLKFIGLVTKPDGMKIAVLTDSKVTLHGREGDIIDGRYRIVKIGVESVELTYADGRGRQTIRLTGQ